MIRRPHTDGYIARPNNIEWDANDIFVRYLFLHRGRFSVQTVLLCGVSAETSVTYPLLKIVKKNSLKH